MVAVMPSFIFGGDTGLTPEELERQRAVATALMQGAKGTPRNLGEGLSAIGNALAYRMAMGKVKKGEKANAEYSDGVIKSLFGPKGGKGKDFVGTTKAAKEVAGTAPGSAQTVDMTGNQVFDDFMGTVKQEVKNPYALAAIAATGKAESGFDPKKVDATWSDPSESGQAGTSGGIMSWRGPRYDAMAATGDLSPSGQAKFFLREDPNLIKALNNAKSVEEAQRLMNNAWKFAGYDRPGGEAGNRLSYANSFLPTFQGQGEAEVASLDPSAGMAEGAIVPGADPIGGASLAEEAAEFRQSPEYAAQRGMPVTGQPMTDEQFAGRFGEQAQPVDASGGMDPVAMALARRGGGSIPAVGAIEEQTNAVPQQFQGSQQLADANGGIMPALNGGQPASAEQIAQAQQAGQQQVAQAQTGGDPGGDGPSLDQLMQAAADPRLSEQGRAVVSIMIKREMARQEAIAAQQAQNSDPLRQLQIKKAQAEVDALGKPTGETKVVGDRLMRIMPDGTVSDVTPGSEGADAGQFRFKGSSVEAQSLNGLMDAGKLTPDQAQQLGAGKTITGPNGEIIFMTPQGVFGSTADGQTQKLSGDVPAEGGAEKGARQGNITLTEPKVTIDERKAMGFADRMVASGKLLNDFEKSGLNVKDQFVRGNDWIPDAAENWMVSDDFQQFDQARRDFINAQLRRESGAVISPEEFDNANKQYFPQPGDTPEVIEQKRANRDVVIKSMARDGGPTYGGAAAEPEGEDPELDELLKKYGGQ